jgi:hypothetical protein
LYRASLTAIHPPHPTCTVPPLAPPLSRLPVPCSTVVSHACFVNFTCRRACLKLGGPSSPSLAVRGGLGVVLPPPPGSRRFPGTSLGPGRGGGTSSCPFPSRARVGGLGTRALGVLPLRRGRLRRRRRIGGRPSASSYPPSALGLDCYFYFASVFCLGIWWGILFLHSDF